MSTLSAAAGLADSTPTRPVQPSGCSVGPPVPVPIEKLDTTHMNLLLYGVDQVPQKQWNEISHRIKGESKPLVARIRSIGYPQRPGGNDAQSVLQTQ